MGGGRRGCRAGARHRPGAGGRGRRPPPDFAAEPTRAEPTDAATGRRPLDYGHRRNVRFAEDALGHLTGGEADRYADWLRVGMCLAELGDDGLQDLDRVEQAVDRNTARARRGRSGGRSRPGTAPTRGPSPSGSLFQRAEAYGFKGHLASRRWAEFELRGAGVLDDGEDPGRLADEARDQRFSFLCDEAVAALEARPDLRDELAAAWGVSAETTRLIGAGLREDMERWLDEFRPTGRWAVTVPLSSAAP